MRHKLKINGVTGYSAGPLWYVECSCGWDTPTKAIHPVNGQNYYGRSTWDAAFALGVAHQKQQKEVCTCDVV